MVLLAPQAIRSLMKRASMFGLNREQISYGIQLPTPAGHYLESVRAHGYPVPQRELHQGNSTLHIDLHKQDMTDECDCIGLDCC